MRYAALILLLLSPVADAEDWHFRCQAGDTWDASAAVIVRAYPGGVGRKARIEIAGTSFDAVYQELNYDRRWDPVTKEPVFDQRWDFGPDTAEGIVRYAFTIKDQGARAGAK